MTEAQLTRLHELATNLTLSSDPKEGLEYWPALNAILAEREAVLQILLPACHSGTNMKTHDAIYRALVAMGERPEAKEGSKSD